MPENYSKPKPTIEAVSEWLTNYHGDSVNALEPVQGGFWSSAWCYQFEEQELVLRFADSPEGYAIDQMAYENFQTSGLPIPRVLDRGEALDLSFAISERHFGSFIETREVRQSATINKTLTNLLAGLRQNRTEITDVNWYAPDHMSWQDWLRQSLADEPGHVTSGWGDVLKKQEKIYDIYQRCQARLDELIPQCPERRDLIHGDLLHQNVLVNDAGTEVTALFSWKCSALGDFLFDVAWCTFWSDWHPVLGDDFIWSATLADESLTEADLIDAAVRHHTYELQIGTGHFGWYVFTQDQENLQRVSSKVARLLDHGPRRLL